MLYSSRLSIVLRKVELGNYGLHFLVNAVKHSAERIVNEVVIVDNEEDSTASNAETCDLLTKSSIFGYSSLNYTS